MHITVIKRDGTKVPFSLHKIERVTTAAGLTSEEAKTLAAQVEAALATNNKTEVTSLEIRDMVLTKLRSVNEYAANMFAWYQKTKD